MVRLDEIIERRRVLRRRVLWWAVVALAAGVAVATPGLVAALLPEPDSSRILFRELAEAHYRATSTSTVVKEYPDLHRLFVDEYNRRNLHRGAAPVDLPAARGLWSYSYVPGGIELTEHGFDEMSATTERPTVTVTEPSDPPFVVWIYSKEQNALAVFFFERLIHDVFEGKPPTPDPRMFLDYDRAGAVGEYGPVPKERLIYTHAWLLPLGDLDARDLLLGESPTRPDVLDFIPTVVRVSAREQFVRPAYGGAPVERARDEARRLGRVVRMALLLVMTIAAALALRAMVSLVRMRREFTAVATVGFGTFLVGNLDAIATRVRDEQRATAAARKDEEERARLVAEIESLSEHPAGELSLAGLRDLRDRLVAQAEARAVEEARTESAQQERQREIRRLEVELGAIPVEAASNEDHDARPSWELLQRALSETGPRERLELLKEARRLLPREYRPTRF